MNNPNDLIVPIEQLLPENLYIIPIRFRPVYPGMVTPLVISPGSLADSLDSILQNATFLGLVLQKDDSQKAIDSKNLFEVGTAAKVVKRINLPEGGVHLLVNTVTRFKIKKFTRVKPGLMAKVEYHRDQENIKDKEIMALTRAVLSNAKEIMNHNPLFTEEMKLTLVNVDQPGKISDFVSSILSLDKEEYQNVLETFSIKERLEKTLSFLSRELDLTRLQQKIQGKIHDKLENQQREYYLREQLKAIRRELGMTDNQEKDIDYYHRKIEELTLPDEAQTKALKEVEKLEYIDSHSSEYGVVRNYLDTIIDLPWATPEYEEIDIKEARRILNRDHYGLEDIKNRIIEHLAVKKLRQSEKGSILCFVGPPGVGKTSLGKSVAAAMKKQFYRFSLGGMRDEAEIKGHRRTYVGAMPGKIIQALKVVKSKDPVLMLDEIDKLGQSFQGDPASALLEVLDPEQNNAFRDHFLDLAYDLSYITFITTANTLDTIPGPLRDRMEVIRLSGYILDEKVQIAKKYIIPRAIQDNGMTRKTAPSLSQAGLKALINGYSREAGVRSLEKQLQKLYRKAATAIVENRDFPAKIENVIHLKEILGPARFNEKDEIEVKAPGCAVGLAWTSMGGATLLIETNASAGRGKFKLTGHIGKVMTESADIAMTYTRSLTQDMNFQSKPKSQQEKSTGKKESSENEKDKFWTRNDIHIHVPDGATPKDGPSAGITITTALYSLFLDKKPKKGFAMTGELSLTGDVLPIGGLKEKLIAARRAGFKNVIFPEENMKDWEDLPGHLKKGMNAHPVNHYFQVKELLF